MCIMAQEGWSTPLLYTKNQNVVYKKIRIQLDNIIGI